MFETNGREKVVTNNLCVQPSLYHDDWKHLVVVVWDSDISSHTFLKKLLEIFMKKANGIQQSSYVHDILES